MSEKLQSELFTRLDAIAVKIGVGAGELWRILVKQAIVKGWTDLLTGLLVALIAIVFCWVSMKMWKKFPDADDPVFLLPLIPALILFVVSISWLISVPGELFNPEYWAYKHLLDGL